MKPSVGRIVLTRDLRDEICPAIIICVHSDECVNLTMFNQVGGTELSTSCMLGETPSQQGWAWPPRVE